MHGHQNRVDYEITYLLHKIFIFIINIYKLFKTFSARYIGRVIIYIFRSTLP
jgi:hypothetical protein